MVNRCTVCGHPDRAEIEFTLATGGSLRDVAGRFELSKSSLSRHMAAHLPADVARTTSARDQERAETLRERLEDLYQRAERIVEQAEQAGRGNVALAGIRELRGILEFAAKLAGSFAPEPPVEIRLTFDDGSPVPRPGPRMRALPEDQEDGDA